LARPPKYRTVNCIPDISYFKPAGVPVRDLEEVILTIDEFEAIRLADLEGMYQEKAAERMTISRQTFGNILITAHRKIADGVVNGKAIKIEGGMYQMEGMRVFLCSDCRHQWEIPFGTGRPQSCPQCNSKNIHRAPQDRGYGRGGRQGKGHRNRRSQ